MKTSAFLLQLQRLGVKVWSESGELRCTAPKGVLTAELKKGLADRREEILAALAAAGEGAGGAKIPRASRAAGLPLSFTQERLWFLQRLEPELTAYNVPLSWTLRGALDVDALERALVEIARRHEVLLTSFPLRDGDPVQAVTTARPALELIDGGGERDGRSDDEWRDEVRRRLVERAGRPMDLDTGPLFRPCLARITADEHVLFVLVHHTVFDGGSIDTFLAELRAIYGAFEEGAASPLADLELQYGDYAAWQRERAAGSGLDDELAYWREALAGELPVLELPADRPRPPVQTYAGARTGVPLPDDLIERLGRLAGGEGATLFMVLLAAYKALLARTTGLEDVVVASPISGRTRPELEGLIGFFANTLVLRTSLAGDPSFRDLLGRVKATCLGAFGHQDTPFERLVDELSPERNLAYSPLFQTLFLVEEGGVHRAGMGSVAMEPFELETHVARTDLMLYAYHDETGWSAWGEYNTDLFDRATVERMLGWYARLLEAAAANPDTPISRLPLLSDAERRKVLFDWNATEAEYPLAPIHAQLESQADATPDAPALVFPGAEEVRLTYRELDERANRVAHHLIAGGVAPGSLVGLCVERSAEMVVALFGILKAGAAYVPLDPSFPADRLSYMVLDAGLSVTVTTSELASLASGTKTVCLDTESEAIAARPATRPSNDAGVEVSASDRMYVIYTSGSTGRPKGVELEHRSVSNFLFSMGTREPGFTSEESLLAVTTLSFDISVLELVLPLVRGGTVIVAPKEAVGDGERLSELIERHAPSVMQATPATWRMLLLSGWTGSPELRLFSGGEALPRELAEELLEKGRELWNLYGPTEATIWSTVGRVTSGEGPVSIGRPIASTRIYVLDGNGEPTPVGVPGELWIGGDGLARGYLGRAELTAERFQADPFVSGVPGARMYRTGDQARWLSTGELECQGRLDNQVKVRGFRIELGEIESVLSEVSGVHQCVCVVREDTPGDQRLVAYTVSAGDAAVDVSELRAAARERLPAYMIPSGFVELAELPLTPNGKIDRRALLARKETPTGVAPGADRVAPRSDLEREIAAVWGAALGLDQVPVHTNFFDLGGHSLLLARVHAKLREELAPGLSMVELFQNPTVALLAERLAGASSAVQQKGRARGRARRARRSGERAGDVAVVGMAGRFPGAKSVDELWRNVAAGVESIRAFSEEECLGDGVEPELLADPSYVKAWGYLEDIDRFDPAFFEITPRDAELTDPQQRLLLEVAWEALENAGCDPERHPGAIGVFAGSGRNAYFLNNLLSNPELMRSAGLIASALVNEKDFLATSLSYKLDLKGPSLTVQTACSTSLVAVHLGCQSLVSGESDVVLAGGATVSVLRKEGYLFVDGGIFASDGHLRAFDHRASGQVGGNGAALVVLKRLEDAVQDGDTIHAVIKGSALNNDGSVKVSFTAPSVDGQAGAIAEALEVAGVDPATVGYVETHGTGTPLGDPIEIAALTQAYGKERGPCPIGSLKTNVGHLDSAAGVSGLIKAALALKNGAIPPSLHFEQPNPEIDFASGPFFVNTELVEWTSRDGAPRRAGVSSLGMGGTNGHIVLEEAPGRGPSSGSRPWQCLTLSARSGEALDEACANLAAHLEAHPETNLADCAHTLQVGRKGFERRRAVVARDVPAALGLLRTPDRRRTADGTARQKDRAVAFLFTGQGAQYPNMTRGLYESEPVYRAELDRVCDLLAEHMGGDLRPLLFPEEGGEEAAAAALKRTENTQPALFAVEYALARLWSSWGIEPDAMAGHSIGEYVAATLAGVFSLADAAKVVAARGRLIGALPEGGAMLAVHLPEEELAALCGDDLDVATVNAPGLCVASGPEASIARLEATVGEQGASSRRLETSHAFHSVLMEPMLEAFASELAGVTLHAPERRFVSCATGTWITAEEAQDPGYWVSHVRRPVRFLDAVATLAADATPVFLEVGPGETLAGLAKLCTAETKGVTVAASARHPKDERADEEVLALALGELWAAGVEVDWSAYRAGETRHRLALPTYPFQRQRYWVDRGTAAAASVAPRKNPDPRQWFYLPLWKQAAPPPARIGGSRGSRWLVFADQGGLAAAVTSELARAGGEVVTVRAGAAFAREDERSFTIDLSRPEDHVRLLDALETSGGIPGDIVYLPSVDAIERDSPAARAAAEETAFYGPLFLGQALAGRDVEELRVVLVTAGMQEVLGGELVAPERALVLGPCKAIDAELEGVACRSIDLQPPGAEKNGVDRAAWLAAELRAEASESMVAHRGAHRWIRSHERVALDAERSAGVSRLREGGVYLVTGGLGGVGLALAEYLAREVRARLVLVGRSGLPDRDAWDAWLGEHGEASLESRRILAVRHLEELGGRVQIEAADVADGEAMRGVIERAEARFGPLNGVIHAAGTAGEGLLALKSREAAAEVLAPKVRGTQVLEELLGGRDLDIVFLCSSIATAIHGVGQVDYFAANAYLDAVARHARGRSKTFTLSVDWDTWREVGMAIETDVPASMRAARDENLRLGMSTQEGREAFGRLLTSVHPQVVVSTRDVTTRVEETRAALVDSEIGGGDAPAPGDTLHARPALSTEYVEPGNDIERQIASIWGDLLGIDRVGVQDNFFELGGNSLVMMQLNVRLRAMYGVALPIRALFETPDVTSLAERIESVRVMSVPDVEETSQETEEFTL